MASSLRNVPTGTNIVKFIQQIQLMHKISTSIWTVWRNNYENNDIIVQSSSSPFYFDNLTYNVNFLLACQHRWGTMSWEGISLSPPDGMGKTQTRCKFLAQRLEGAVASTCNILARTGKVNRPTGGSFRCQYPDFYFGITKSILWLF